MPRPDSIREMGLKNYLNATKEKHADRGYDYFCEVVEDGLSDAAIGKLFKVSRHAANRWRTIYELEKVKNNAS